MSNTLGNLLNRATASKLNPEQVYPHFDEKSLEYLVAPENASKLIDTVRNLPYAVEPHYDNFHFYKANKIIFDCVREANALIQANELWNYDMADKQKIETLNSVVYCSYEAMRVSAILLQPLLPVMAHKVLDKLSIPQEDRTLENAGMCFWNKYSGFKLSSNRDLFYKKIKK